MSRKAPNLQRSYWICSTLEASRCKPPHRCERMENMSRFFSYAACSLFLLISLAMSAGATPMVGGAIGASQSQSLGANVGGLFNSSLKGAGTSYSDHGLHGAPGLLQTSGFAPHQFSLRVPTPVASETPEPSTLALFGTGLIMLGGAVRRKFLR